MLKFNVFDAQFSYDESDPDGYRAGGSDRLNVSR